jgi:hypothetical protein
MGNHIIDSEDPKATRKLPDLDRCAMRLVYNPQNWALLKAEYFEPHLGQNLVQYSGNESSILHTMISFVSLKGPKTTLEHASRSFSRVNAPPLPLLIMVMV